VIDGEEKAEETFEELDQAMKDAIAKAPLGWCPSLTPPTLPEPPNK